MVKVQFGRLKFVSTTMRSASGAAPLFFRFARAFPAAIPATVVPCAVIVSKLVHVPALIDELSQTIP